MRILAINELRISYLIFFNRMKLYNQNWKEVILLVYD